MIVEVWLACALVNGEGVRFAIFDSYETCGDTLLLLEKNSSVLGLSQCAPVKMDFPERSQTGVPGAGVTVVTCAPSVPGEGAPSVP